MILLVGDTVVHPGETGPQLSVETSNRLEHSDLSHLSNLAIAPSMRALQNPDQCGLRAVTVDTGRILSDEDGEVLPREITVGRR